VFIFTAFEPCSGTIKVIGVVCVHIGICGVEIIITSDHVGSGAVTERLAATNIVCESTSVGMDLGGMSSALIGICIVAITTITICTAGIDGHGDASAGLVCTFTDCVHCTVITRDTGDACVHTGTSGGEIITIGVLGGSGQTSTARSVDISTACASTNDGMVLDGTMFDRTGTCGERIAIITICTVAFAGYGVATEGLACIGTAYARSTGTTRVTGGVCDLTGICGEGTIITDVLDGFVQIPKDWAAFVSIAYFAPLGWCSLAQC